MVAPHYPKEYRFFDKIRLASEGLIDNCWFWRGPFYVNGYGIFNMSSAHRYSFEYFKGKIPKGLVIHHVCHNRSCVNPEHLEAIAKEKNLKDKRFKYY